MSEYLEPGALERFLASWEVSIQATFSYCGSEIVVVAARETENPRRNISKAVRRVFWRFAIFYVLIILLIGICVSSSGPRLLSAIQSGARGIAASPFVIAIKNGGIKGLRHVNNAVVLTTVWSAGNSYFYASS